MGSTLLDRRGLGSVNNPVTDDLRASYVIIHADDARHLIEHRRVSYDRDQFLRRLRSSGHPEQDFIASFHRGEQIRHTALPLDQAPRPGRELPE